MIPWFFFTFFYLSGFSALAVQNKDITIKVESEKEQKKPAKKQTLPQESLEIDNTKIQYSEIGFWSQSPKLVIAGGLSADKEFFKSSKDNRWFLGAGLHLRHRNWHRAHISTQMLQNNNFVLNGSWELTPSRKALRHYYGLGLSHLMVSQKEFRNLLEPKNYFLTGNVGFEYLLESQHGLNIELKAFLGLETYALQISLGYIIPL